MSCKYNFITDLGLQSSITSQYFHLKSKIKIFFYVGIFLKFICAYLGICWPIFSQIEIFYSWNNTLSELLLLFFILMTSSWSKIRFKGISSNFASLRVMCINAMGNWNSVKIHTKSTVHPFAFIPRKLADKITFFVGC